ncbi:tetratricopeptide repeat protein [Rubellicoccus peritrichatus]|uniref:Tetratricopeptide repeat protein n=1 Tax=Rubellicoccus peritrichatus TaxID=3080537 RepID=A0AAQ3L9T2_9BACT|nr:tetratricopeptide repeat protein [Puniceicoccus sp. CR14]WOO41307.1 hypothetical protein RZN69_22025 [Puniceicoccus sp. CR14]
MLLGLAIRERGPSGRWRIRIRWGILFGLLAITGVAGYFLLVTSFYFYFKKVEQFDEVSYWDMFTLIFNRSDHREKVGNYQIEQAKHLLEEGEFRKALQYLQTGVIRAPENLDGRTYLADFFMFGFNQEDRAIQILREGVPYAYDNPDYLKKYVQVLLSYQEDDEVVQIAENILASDPSPEVERIMALGAATASYYRGRFDLAEDFLKDYNLDGDLEGALLSARISWDRGERKVALAKLESDLGKFRNDEPIYELLSRFYREMGDNAKARQYAVLRNINAPLSVAPRIDLLQILSATDQKDRARKEAESILYQFANDETSLQQLANYATDAGEVDLSRRIYERALENDFKIAPFALLLIESHVTAGDYQGAIAFSSELVKEKPEWIKKNWPIFNSLRSVAYYGLGNEDLTELYLQQFLEAEEVRIGSLLAVSNRFQKLGGKEEAREILMQAYERNPDNQAALSSLISLEIELGNSAELGPYLEKLLKMRRPSTTILQEAYKNLGSDKFIFTKGRAKLLIELNGLISPADTNEVEPS